MSASDEEFQDFLIQQIINLPEGMSCFYAKQRTVESAFGMRLAMTCCWKATTSSLGTAETKCQAPRPRCIVLPGTTCTVINDRVRMQGGSVFSYPTASRSTLILSSNLSCFLVAGIDHQIESLVSNCAAQLLPLTHVSPC